MAVSTVEEKQDELVQVRFSWPKDVHKKIRSHQRKLSAHRDDDITMEAALVDFIRKAVIK